MKHGLFLPQGFGNELAGFDDPSDAYAELLDVARAADESGYETVWLADHFHPAPPGQSYLFECWTTAAALARETTRVRIGQMVTGNGYRNPALQAKMASTLDVLAGGRYTFGIGAGWWEPDYTGYGYEFADVPGRLRRLGEAVQVIRALWTQDEATFEGEYYRVRGAINQPKGVQRPGIPMLIAGGGEKVTLKLVAQFGDACNVSGGPELARHKFEVLRGHCEAAGRDYDAIHRTVMTPLVLADTDEEARAMSPEWSPAIYPGDVASYGLIGSPETVARRIAAYEEAGVQELALGMVDPLDVDMLRRFAKECLGGSGVGEGVA